MPMPWLDPVLMLGPFSNDLWMELEPTLPFDYDPCEITPLDIAEMLVLGSPSIVLAPDADTPAERLNAAVQRSYKNREEALRKAALEAERKPKKRKRKKE